MENFSFFDGNFLIDPIILSLIKSKKCLIVGFSGGPDSSALLHWLYCLKRTGKIDAKIVAVHINHQLRGEESIRDENFAKAFCEQRNIEIRVFKANVNKICKINKTNIEETARNIRYDFFGKVSSEFSQSLILTAHTLTDSVETFIYRAARGASLEGLCGIPKIRNKVIRPFINLTKKQIYDFCIKNNINFIHDSSNDDLSYSRNKIRHKILPILSELNTKYEKNFGRTFYLLKQDSDFLNSLALQNIENSKIGEDLYKIDSLQPDVFPLFSRSLKMIFFDYIKRNQYSVISNIAQKHIDLVYEIVKKKQGSVNVAKNVFIRVINNIMRIYSKKIVKDGELLERSCFSINELLTSGVEGFKIGLIECSDSSWRSFADSACCVSFDAMPDSAVFRRRFPGDRINLFPRGVTKSLKKLYNEASVPVDIRESLAVIACDNVVLWAEGFGSSGATRVTADTKRVLVIKRTGGVFGFVK